MEFKNLRHLYIESVKIEKAKYHFYIENGYIKSWSDKEKENPDPDRGLKYNLTATRWQHYLKSEITRVKAVELAIKRYDRQKEKEMKKMLFWLDDVANAPDLTFMNVNVKFVRSATWGYNPHATVSTNFGTFYGKASGCGYDKESAAVAQALNQNASVMKVLYSLKEKALEKGISDNRTALGCGSYGVVPYFEGGVGVGCFWKILKQAGFEIHETYGKHERIYNIYKGVEK